MSRFDKKGEIDITMTREAHDALLEAADKLPDERDEIIRDLAASNPVVHVSDGYCTRYACQLCGKELRAADAVHRFYLNHADTCPWRRAKELNP